MGDDGRISDAPSGSPFYAPHYFAIRSPGAGETCGATYYKSVRCVSSGTLPLFVALSGLKLGEVTHKSVLSGDGIQFPYPHPTQSALRPPFSACLLREMGVWKIFFAGVGSFANFAIWRGNIRDGVGLSLCP